MIVVGVLEHFVVPEIIVPIAPGFVSGVKAVVSIAGVVAFVIVRPHLESFFDLPNIIPALEGVTLVFGPGQGREEERSKDADNGYYHQQLD